MIENETIAIIGLMLAPVYSMLIWRIKVSSKIEKKLSNLCLAFLMEFPKYKGILKS